MGMVNNDLRHFPELILLTSVFFVKGRNHVFTFTVYTNVSSETIAILRHSLLNIEHLLLFPI